MAGPAQPYSWTIQVRRAHRDVARNGAAFCHAWRGGKPGDRALEGAEWTGTGFKASEGDQALLVTLTNRMVEQFTLDGRRRRVNHR